MGIGKYYKLPKRQLIKERNMLAIIEAVEKEDDRTLLTEWYLEFNKIMRKKAYDIIKDYDLASDMVNEAFIKIIKNIEKIKELNCHGRAVYFVSTIRSVSIDYLRKKKIELQHVEQFEGSDALQNSTGINQKEFDSYEKKEYFADVERAFSMLAERDRYLPIYRYAWDMSSKEIAEFLNIKENNVNSYVKRAKSKLIRILDGEV